MASLQERKGREGEWHDWGTTWGEGGLQGECHGGLTLHATMSLLFVRMQLLLLAWEETGRRKKRGEEREKKGRREGKKKKFPNMEISEK
jgi:hypothetical protein